MKNYIFTSESVTRGHPDKICDIISDRILDEALSQDAYSKMAVEATIKDDLILIYGEQNTKAVINFEDIAKKTLQDIGYKENYNVIVKVNNQSSEINNAISHPNGEFGAGDQGIMFGYANSDTPSLMPAPIFYAHKLAKQLELIQNKYDFLGPDGKTQVSVEYVDDTVNRIDTILISCQHTENIEKKVLNRIIVNEVIKPCINNNLIDNNTKLLINPSGSFILGGSFGDSGTTGRKIVVDTYGGMGHIGGGCLSSKDPTKVDRSAAYYARYVAKNIVANGLAKKCEIQVSYAIGKSNPVSICVDTFGTSRLTEKQILDIIKINFNFNLNNILEELDLRKPIYANTACYGHFGKENLSWEKVIKLKI